MIFYKKGNRKKIELVPRPGPNFFLGLLTLNSSLEMEFNICRLSFKLPYGCYRCALVCEAGTSDLSTSWLPVVGKKPEYM